MAIDLVNGKVRVYNYELSPVGFPSLNSKQGVFLSGRSEDEEFVVERVAMDDIEAENSKSDLFKVGRIRFHPDEEDQIYKKIGIDDRENIMSDKELIAYLSVDTIDKIKHISNLKSLTLISRMKSMLFTMERSGKIPPPRITAAILERSAELISGGKRHANSEISKVLDAEAKANEESKLRETLDSMQQQLESIQKKNDEELKAKDALIAQSQSALEKLLKQVEDLTKAQAIQTQSTQNKQPGRPPKTSE